MNQICDNCKRSVEGLVAVAGPADLYQIEKRWCFACVYEKALADYESRKSNPISDIG
jgi:recombinational DNA repair protein RecR